MYKLWDGLKQNFWPVSALLLCPCHLPLSMAAIASLTAGTALGAYISTHYSSIETVLAVVFSERRWGLTFRPIIARLRPCWPWCSLSTSCWPL
jgi:hypothetical protein